MPLHIHRFITSLRLINEEVSVEELFVNKLLHANIFQSNADEADTMGVQSRPELADLARSQPTVYSSEAAQEGDDGRTVLPQGAERNHLTV